METNLTQCLCYKLQFLNRLLMQKLNEEIRSYGVTQGQLPVLCCLVEGEGKTQTDLCEQIQVEQPTMANTLRRMERDGLIYRTPCEQDKRQSLIFLTEQTRPIVELLQKKRDEVLSRMTRHITPEQLAAFHRTLDIARSTLENPELDESNIIQETE